MSQNDEGTGPVRKLLYSCNHSILVSLPSSDGMGPMSWLAYSSIASSMFTRFPNSVGIVPVKFFKAA